MNKKMLLAISLLLNFAIGYGQCAYPGTPLVQVGSDYTFCIDNSNTFTTTSFNSGRYVVVNVVKGFSYTFSVGNVFGGSGVDRRENLTLFDASNNVIDPTGATGYAFSNTGATISNWISPLSGKIKVLLSRGNCSNNNDTGGALTLTLNSVGNTQDSQTAFGTDQWVGHVYNWTGTTPPGGTSPTTPSTTTTPFINANYVGYYNIANETINEGFGGNTACFPVLSDGVNLTNIYTETFAVRYRMRSTKTGCYLLSVNGDDGVRVYVDNVLVFDAWREQGNTTYCNNLIYLNGASDIIFDYYENGGGNVVGFSLTEFVPTTNTIAGAAIRNVCSGVSPGVLDGSAYLPCATSSISNIKFQWQVSTDNLDFTDISGATSEDYTPAAITTGTNVVRYYRRVLKASASNAGSCEFNTNVIRVNTSAVLGTVGAISGATPQCPSLIGQVYSVTAVTNALNYAWTVPTGWTITGGQGTNSITVTTGTSGQNGNISVTASNGCNTSVPKQLVVSVSPLPTAVTAAPNKTTICQGETINLTASSTIGSASITLIDENFNGSTNSWTTTNTSTGGTPANATWTLRPNAYNNGREVINSNDASQFYLSDSDAQGTGGTTATILTSSSFSTVGLSSASLSFYHYYRYYNVGESANIEISTNGSTWTTLTTYTSSQGTRNNFSQVTVNLAPYLEQANVYVRFRYAATNDWYWAVDNVSIIGVANNTPATYAWTSTPAGFTSSVQNPTGVAPTVNTTYTVTVTNASGCAASATTVAVVVNPNLPASVSIVASATTICAGTNVTFTATPTNGGTTPSYQWKVNGVNAGTNNATFSSTSLINGDIVTVVLTSNATPCLTGSPVTSNAIVITVNPLPTTPTFSKTDIDCINPSGSITVTVQNAGETYSFDNGAIFQSGNSKSGLVAGAYNVVIKSAAGCLSPATASVVIADKSSTTWNGSAWSNDPPSSTKKIIFAGDYTFGINLPASDLAGCSCEVLSGIIIVPDGKTLTLTNELKVTGGSLTFENNASLVQVNDNAINTGKIYYKRHTTAVRRYDYTYWSSPVQPQTMIALSPNTLSDKFWSFDSDANDWVLFDGGGATMEPANGYSIRAPQTSDIVTAAIDTNPTFFGVPNNGNYTVSSTATAVNNKSYLLGNPYPSALDAFTFLSNNSSVLDGTLYFWTHNSNVTAVGAFYEYSDNDYATFNLTGGTGVASTNPGVSTSPPTGKIAAGQGFFATGIATGPINFTNAMRVGVGSITGDNSQFFRTTKTKAKTTTAIEKNRVWLNLYNTKGAFKQALIGYVTGATNAYDSGYDGESFDGNEFVDFYSVTPENYLVIQGRALPFDETDTVPLGYRSKEEMNLNISIDQTDGVLATQNIYIEDKLLNVIHNIKDTPYAFTTEAGTFDNRFVLRYTDKTLGNTDFEGVNSSVVISKDKNELKIKSEIEIIKRIVVYDLLGKKVFEKEAVNSTEFRSSAIGFSQQIGIVKVTLDNGQVISKKVIF